MGDTQSYENLLKESTKSIDTDVLVIGGGPAGTWAAWKAAQSGARVVLVDKGYCGTSGATAPSGTGIWYVKPDQEDRLAALQSRDAMGGKLGDHAWMHRVLDRTYENVNLLAEWGFPFPLDDQGEQFRGSLNGPHYMNMMRKKIRKAGVTILDHSPALQLLVDEHGVGGAYGHSRQTGGNWIVRAGAVVIATGGCAFLSKALGCNVLTGDGYLLAAEAGGDMSGMEFSNAYAISLAFGSVTKTAFYKWASFYRGDGSLIEKAGSLRGRSEIGKVLLSEPVFAKIDKADAQLQAWMRISNPNFFVPLDRAGIDPFTQPFPITLRLEGTVRGTGGIRITDYGCATTVNGLYACGDAATRELICGGFTGGGSHNAAWATSSGYWAGESAAAFSKKLGPHQRQRKLRGAGTAGIVSAQTSDHSFTESELVKKVQDEVFPYDKNWFREEQQLTKSLDLLNQYWVESTEGLTWSPDQAIRARESIAMLATARMMYTSALHRKETRGMHKRTDYAGSDSQFGHRLLTRGLDQITVHPETISTFASGVGQ